MTTMHDLEFEFEDVQSFNDQQTQLNDFFVKRMLSINYYQNQGLQEAMQNRFYFLFFINFFLIIFLPILINNK